MTTTIIITYDYGMGSHAAVHVDHGEAGFPAIYDPSGSYSEGAWIYSGRGDIIDWPVYVDSGVSPFLRDYVNYHISTGSHVKTFAYQTTPEQETQIMNNAKIIGGGFGPSCAVQTSRAINQVGPFKGLGIKWTPATLEIGLKTLKLIKESGR
jgi:hypothetical protein